jgi:hypothetical protein
MDIGDHYYGTSVQEEGKKLKKNKLIPMYCWTYCHQTRLPVMLYPNPQSFHKNCRLSICVFIQASFRFYSNAVQNARVKNKRQKLLQYVNNGIEARILSLRII